MTWLFNFLNQTLRHPVFDVVMPLASFLLEPLVVLSVLGAAVLGAWWKPSWRKAVTGWLILILVLSVLNFGLKKYFHHPRPFWQESGVHYFDSRHWHDLVQPLTANTVLPHESDTGFPSGHAMLAFGIAGYLWRRVIKKQKIVLLAGALLVAVSRVYLGVHYPIDVAVGGVLGWLIGFVWCHFL